MRKHLAVFIGSALLFGCAPKNHKEEPHDHLNDDLKLEYAKNIRSSQNGDSVQIDVYNPDTGELEASVTSPGNKELRIISMSATTDGMFAQLGEQKLLVGVSNGAELYDKELIKRYKERKITEFLDEEIYSIEKIIASQANVILYSGYNRDFPNKEKLQKLGVQLIPLYDWREEHPFGKAEWIKLIGILTDHLSEAENYFNEMVSNYNDLQLITDTLTQKPTVLAGNLFNDIWYTPVGDSYMAKLIRDAGGDYVYKDSKGTGSLALSIEKILHDNANTDIWINPGLDSREKLLKMNPHAKHLKAIENMYGYSPNMNKFWEQSSIMPDKVLSDLIHVFHPELVSNKSLYFYQKID